MKSEITFYKTSGLSEGQKNGFCSLFERVFGKKKERAQFDRQFTRCWGGNGYHSLGENRDEVNAVYSCVPYRYSLAGEEMTVALSVDSIVTPESKLGPFGIKDLGDIVLEKMSADGIRHVFGFPNNNFYDYATQIIGFRDIGVLDFYVLPLNLGQVKKALTPLNIPTRYFARFFCRFASWFASSKPFVFRIQKVDDELFRGQRYDERHRWITLRDGSEVVYTLYDEGKLGTVAYIVDITKPSPKNFYRAFASVARAVGSQASMVAYPCGKLPFKTPLRIPRRFLPRQLHMVGMISDETEKDEIFFDMDNWNVNLSNFDTR